MLRPKSIAVVGVSESSGLANSIKRSHESGAMFHYVHPKVTSVFGQKAYPDLLSLGEPVDLVFSAVNAANTVSVVRQGAELGVGGVVSVAGGFAELGDVGARLQDEILEHATAGGFPVIGPNGIGLIDVRQKLDLCLLPHFNRRVGGVSAAMHSGGMIEAMGAAAWRAGGVGFSTLISAGNEAVTDLADYLEYFAEDDDTRIIALAIEKIRRPDAFFAAARKCREADKPIIALKWGRSERARRIAASHTGTLTGGTWIYDVAFKQSGIISAYDIDDLVDRLQFLDQLPRQKWTEVRGLAVLTMTGGNAALASDLAEAENVDVPEAERLIPFIAANVPGGTVANPLDATGFAANPASGLWTKILAEYVDAPEFDAFLYASQHADWDARQPHLTLAPQFAEVAAKSGKPFVVAPLAGPGGWWLDDIEPNGLAVGNGLRGCLKGFAAMAAFMRSRRDSQVQPASAVARIPQPDVTPIETDAGLMLPFDATMTLLGGAGIPVAPYRVIDTSAPVSVPSFTGPYVVKLADVPHRTELGAVLLNVAADGLAAAVEELRELAGHKNVTATVAIQPMVSGHGEAFVGINCDSELGPVVAFGLGGIFVEIMKRVGGRMAPMSSEDASDLIDEFSDTGVIEGFRGARPWDRGALNEVLVAASRLAAGAREWVASIDINPLIVTAEGMAAVDGLCLLREP
jgi:acyl-CoA synthetase (NDP forming)